LPLRFSGAFGTGMLRSYFSLWLLFRQFSHVSFSHVSISHVSFCHVSFSHVSFGVCYTIACVVRAIWRCAHRLVHTVSSQHHSRRVQVRVPAGGPADSVSQPTRWSSRFSFFCPLVTCFRCPLFSIFCSSHFFSPN
jgi:hypothetical protein